MSVTKLGQPGVVQNSVLSQGVRVEGQAVVKDSIIVANTVIGKHNLVERRIVDEGVNVGEFCYVGFGNSLVPGGCDITCAGPGRIGTCGDGYRPWLQDVDRGEEG